MPETDRRSRWEYRTVAIDMTTDPDDGLNKQARMAGSFSRRLPSKIGGLGIPSSGTISGARLRLSTRAPVPRSWVDQDRCPTSDNEQPPESVGGIGSVVISQFKERL